MLELLGVNFETEVSPDHSIRSDKHQYEDMKEIDEFDEFNVRAEPSLATKNVVYTLLSDAHYDRKENLRKEFGPTTTTSDHEYEKDKTPSESDDSDNSENEYFNKHAAIDMM